MKEEFEKFIVEKKHKKFLKNESFDTGFFGKENRLLKIVIVPEDISPEHLPKLNFNDREVREWLMKNSYGGRVWKPFLNGVRFIDEDGDKVGRMALLFNNRTTSFCQELPVIKAGEHDCISVRDVRYHIRKHIDFTQKFYEFIDFLIPKARIYVELTEVKGLYFDQKEFERLELMSAPLVDFEQKLHIENLKFYEESSGQKMKDSLDDVKEQVSDRLYRAFGIWIG